MENFKSNSEDLYVVSFFNSTRTSKEVTEETFNSEEYEETEEISEPTE